MKTIVTGEKSFAKAEAMNLQADWFCLDCRVGMKWVDGMFWKCPECGTEVWPEEPEAVEREKKQAAADNSGMVSRAWIPGTESKGGGGASGKSRKKPLRKSDFRHRVPLD